MSDRARRLFDFIQTHGYGLIFAHLAKFLTVALYFMLLQWPHGQVLFVTILNRHLFDIQVLNVKWGWDHMFSTGLFHVMPQVQWDTTRHKYRYFYEGLFGILFYGLVIFDAQKYILKTKVNPGKINRVLLKIPLLPNRYKPVTVGQLIFLPVYVIVIGLIIAIPMLNVVLPYFHTLLNVTWLEPQLSSNHASFLEKFYNGDYDAIAIGVVTGLVIRFVVHPVHCTMTLSFCRQWTELGFRSHQIMSPGMRHTLEYVSQVNLPKEGKLHRVSSLFGFAFTGLAFITLMAYGAYILAVIAK